MNELIKIVENEEGIQTVNARELHEFLDSKRQFADWIKQRIDKYGFVEEVDFTIHKFVNGKATQKDYFVSLDMAKELSMVENNDKGRQARKYFIECEKRLKEVAPMFQIPKTYSEALRLAADQAEQIEDLRKDKRQLQVKAIRDQPKIEFYDQVINSDGAMSMNDTAKVLGIPNFGRTKLFEYLRNRKVLDGNNVPYQKFVDAGWFNVTESKYETDWGVNITRTTRVYQKGLDGIRRALKKDGYLK